MEERIVAADGATVWVKTSGRPLYEPTRSFYARCGFRKAAALAGYYAPDDPKVIYSKTLSAPSSPCSRGRINGCA